MSERADGDYYPTPPPLIATARQLLPEHLGRTLDPAAGDGRFGRVLGERSGNYPHTWLDLDICPGDLGVQRADFLHWDSRGYAFETIVTNPPFSKITDYVEQAQALHLKRILFLARLALLEGQDRYRRLWRRWPPDLVAVLVSRPSFREDGAIDRWAYAWFGWGDFQQTGICWLDWKGAPKRG